MLNLVSDRFYWFFGLTSASDGNPSFTKNSLFNIILYIYMYFVQNTLHLSSNQEQFL
jgi:hypothetical protein